MKPEELHAMFRARRGLRFPRTSSRKLDPTADHLEHPQQCAFVEIARAEFPDVVMAAVPNGGGRSRGEAGRLRAEGVLAGYPDLLVDEPLDGWHGMRIEMKRADGLGVESDDQKTIRHKLTARGFYCVVCDGCDEALRELRAYLSGDRPRF